MSIQSDINNCNGEDRHNRNLWWLFAEIIHTGNIGWLKCAGGVVKLRQQVIMAQSSLLQRWGEKLPWTENMANAYEWPVLPVLIWTQAEFEHIYALPCSP